VFECDVVVLVHDGLVENLAREERPEAKDVHAGDVKDVLVEDVENEHGVAAIAFAAMNEQEGLKEFELANGEVSGPSSLLALSA
jgi:hypothetical protein